MPETPARNPDEFVVTNLRLRESVRAALETEAKRNGTSLNREMVRRLEDSMEAGAKLQLSTIASDLTVNWLRFGERFLALELEEGMLKAIEDGDLASARAQVFALRQRQEAAARQRTAKTAPAWTETVRAAIAAKTEL
jgi:hypothetical protein